MQSRSNGALFWPVLAVVALLVIAVNTDNVVEGREKEAAERLAGLRPQLALRQVEDQQLSAVQRLLDIQLLSPTVR